MSIDQKIRLALMAVSVITTLAFAAHFGHAPAIRLPFLDETGPGNGSG